MQVRRAVVSILRGVIVVSVCRKAVSESIEQ